MTHAITDSRPEANASSLPTRALLAANLLVYAGFVVGFVAAPRVLARALGIALETPSALADFRATYAGLSFGVGVVLVLGLVDRGWTRAALVLCATSALGLFAGRALTRLGEGPLDAYNLVSMALELGTVAIAALLLRRDAALGA